MEQPSEPSLASRLGQPIKHVNPLLKEFRDFAMRGNVIDLAVGVIIGAAFGKIVDALVTKVLMPVLSLLTGKISLTNEGWVLSSQTYATLDDARKAHAPIIDYGIFLDAIINFLIVSFTIFLCIRLLGKFYRKPEAPPAPKKDCPFCCSSIALAATRCPQCTSALPEAKT